MQERPRTAVQQEAGNEVKLIGSQYCSVSRLIGKVSKTALRNLPANRMGAVVVGVNAGVNICPKLSETVSQ